jgi:hypothetical protein
MLVSLAFFVREKATRMQGQQRQIRIVRAVLLSHPFRKEREKDRAPSFMRNEISRGSGYGATAYGSFTLATMAL